MGPYGVFAPLLWLSLLFSSASAKHDFRYISYQDLQQTLNKFSQHDVVSYSQMLFDVARNQVLVGARDFLLRLSLSKLQLLEYTKWQAPKDKRTQCINKGQSDEFCHNFIKILVTNNKYLFACGTNAFSPQCSYRKIENISEVSEWVDGLAKCPYSPDANITGFMTEGGEYYFGGPTDFSSTDYLISKTIGTDSTIRTTQYNSLWLNDPQFVGSFETDEFVYFLFREVAVEYINCGKIVYSRIGRVCKNDPGGHTMLKDNWTTFLKARLNCSISGEYPFYFDEIQSMSYVPDEHIVYATFTTPTNSIAGSAICAFNLTAIDAAFAGPVKYQENMESAWGRHSMQHRDHFECKSSVQSNHLLETSKYQLMDKAVQATTLSPLHVAQLERFTHITIDVLSTKLHTYFHIIYVATTEGLIKKISVLPRTLETCVVEVWKVVPDAASPIRSLQFLKQTNSVYVTTDTGVMKIPAEHCGRHKSEDSCANAMDPYCGWDERYESCSTAPHLNPLDKLWKQSVTSCPILDAVIDGSWSSWSEWHYCLHRTSPTGDSSDSCLCQTRECNNPAPQNGGILCEGPSVAVINCTIHGGWSDWSAWSACSATCGTAVKTRSRTCTNPAPAHGGRVCVGQDRAEAFCDAEIPPCPTLAQDGNWGKWGPWSSCPAHCGGFKKRFRYCDSPAPTNGGQYCIGNNFDVGTCNDCQELKKTVHTEWIYDSNTTSGEHHKSRIRFTCKAPVKDNSMVKISMKKEMQTCNSNNDCYTNESGLFKWSVWSNWSDCSVTCGGGEQTRNRYCEGRGCQGPPMQTRECNRHSCEEWGCWSDWSPCNVSCGWGVQTRRRKCLGHNCRGSDREEQPCEKPSCDSLLGWGNWTSWSLCDLNNEQHRKRQCRTLNPGPNMCQGGTIETRMCIPDDISAMSQDSVVVSASVSTVILCTIIGICVGAAIGLAFMYFYEKRKKHRKIPSSPHYMGSTENPYIQVPLHEIGKNKKRSTSSSVLNNVPNGTIKSMFDFENTLKRNSHLNNGHTKQTIDENYY